MDVTGIQHVQVNVAHERADDARGFYGELLGLVEIERPQSLSDKGSQGVWYRVTDAQEVHVTWRQDAGLNASASSQHPAFIVDGLDELHARLEVAGIDVEEAVPIAGRKRFFARDPGGNRIEFLSFVE
jgi:catechol 2,3-dioxygenase-like lactoylglutathione lyase family enzyme